MSGALRGLLALAAAANLVLAGGFALQQPWALRLWPWATGRLSYLFVASMLTAVAFGAAWAAAAGESGSLPAGFADLTVTSGGLAAFLVAAGSQRRLGVALAAVALVNAALFAWARRLPRADAEPMPALARWSYGAFALILAAAGLAMVLRTPAVMPWPVDPTMSVVIGWMFLGSACYFAYALRHPHWNRARAQLWSFLGYDLVLLPPLLAHLRTVDPALRRSLLVYLAVLAYSAALALYYLLANRRSRGWGRSPRNERLAAG